MAAPPRVEPYTHPTGGATTESMDVDEGNEEVLEVEEAEEQEEEELDPRTLGVPGLKTLVPGDHVEVLWANGAFYPPFSCPQNLKHLSYCTTCAQAGRGGESTSARSRCGQVGPSSSTASRTTTAMRRRPLLHTPAPTVRRERSSTQNSRASAARGATGGRGPAHAPGTEGLRGGVRGGRAVRPAVPEHAEKSIGWRPRQGKARPRQGGSVP